MQILGGVLNSVNAFWCSICTLLCFVVFSQWLEGRPLSRTIVTGHAWSSNVSVL